MLGITLEDSMSSTIFSIDGKFEYFIFSLADATETTYL